jgi:U3 small nucleolar RNA-associated protein 20
MSSTFHEMAPLLGKTHQKQYVRRFASEAFAFLLRKVKEPSDIVALILSDVKENEEYSEAIENVFVESLKAPRRSLHSKAQVLLDALIQNVSVLGESLPL